MRAADMWIYLVVLPSGSTFPYCTTFSTLDAFAPAEVLANGRDASAGAATARTATLKQRSICGEFRVLGRGDRWILFPRLHFRRHTAEEEEEAGDEHTQQRRRRRRAMSTRSRAMRTASAAFQYRFTLKVSITTVF
jgi:hypothetical protein